MTWPKLWAILATVCLATVCLATVCLVAAPAFADDCHESSSPQTPAAGESAGRLTIPDPVLVDQDGREVRFYSDLVAGRRVAMNFIFTTCTTVCPPMGASFARLQRLIEEKGDDVELISVSVDPAVDTPERLRAWGETFGRGDGWTLVTGPKQEVDALLKALKVFTPIKEDHSPTVLLGDAARNRWTRAYGLASPATFLELLGGLDAPAPAAEAAP